MPERDEYRVVREDGEPVSQLVQQQTRAQADYLLAERRRAGGRGPYRIQRRVIVVGPWEDVEQPVTKGDEAK